MKVILKGVCEDNYENTPEIENRIIKLKQLPFPITHEVRNNCVNLTKYFCNQDWPKQEIWGLVWFDYEEIKEVQD